jgi:hypothetical protein
MVLPPSDRWSDTLSYHLNTTLRFSQNCHTNFGFIKIIIDGTVIEQMELAQIQVNKRWSTLSHAQITQYMSSVRYHKSVDFVYVRGPVLYPLYKWHVYSNLQPILLPFLVTLSIWLNTGRGFSRFHPHNRVLRISQQQDGHYTDAERCVVPSHEPADRDWRYEAPAPNGLVLILLV